MEHCNILIRTFVSEGTTVFADDIDITLKLDLHNIELIYLKSTVFQFLYIKSIIITILNSFYLIYMYIK